MWAFEASDMRNISSGKSINNICGDCVDKVLKTAMQRESLDNLSVVMIAFQNF